MAKNHKFWVPYKTKNYNDQWVIRSFIHDANENQLMVEWNGDSLRIDTKGCRWMVVSMSEIGRLKRLFYSMEKMILDEQKKADQYDLRASMIPCHTDQDTRQKKT